MRKITIIGGGQSGLQLAIGLIKAGYSVRVVQNRTAEDIATGKVMSSQCMFHNSVEHERELGIDFWSDTCPPVDGINFQVPAPDGSGHKAIDWTGRLDHSAYSVDQRVKIPAWMAEFERLGGTLTIKDATIADLEHMPAGRSGHRRLGQGRHRPAVRARCREVGLRDPAAGPGADLCHRHDAASRAFGGLLQPDPRRRRVFRLPGADHLRPLRDHGVRGRARRPDGLLGDVKTPEQHLATSKKILETFLPWEAARCESIELTDDNGILAGRFAPTIRKPIGTLPSGRQVLGLGDAVCLNDPITGQGSNNAAKAAAVYLKRILAHGDKPFDAAFMQGTFDEFWDYAQWVVSWTNMMLQPPPPFILNIMGTACVEPRLAHRMANGFERSA
jgi:hypothetical protein